MGMALIAIWISVFLSSKGEVGNKARLASSICNAYMMEEIKNFIANYFDDEIDTKARDLPRNVMRVERDKANVGLHPIFYQNVGY